MEDYLFVYFPLVGLSILKFICVIYVSAQTEAVVRFKGTASTARIVKEIST